jgi:hypothetical protein
MQKMRKTQKWIVLFVMLFMHIASPVNYACDFDCVESFYESMGIGEINGDNEETRLEDDENIEDDQNSLMKSQDEDSETNLEE